MKVGIYTNITKNPANETTLRLINSLRQNGVEYALHCDLKHIECGEYFDLDNFDVDLMFTLGGDGTVLRVAKYCANKGIPIVGINIGTIGFLTEIEPNDIEKAVPEIVKGNYRIEKRSMLEFFDGKEERLALNDVVLNRDFNTKLLVVELYINDKIVDRYHCDGFIVSTPTGSTAYSLSAGGAIVSPKSSVLALTPINPHSLHSRPIVVDENEKVCLKMVSDVKVSVMVDGEIVSRGKLDRLKVQKSAKYAQFIRLDEHNFYNKLLGKLNKWSVVDIEE